VRFSGSPGGEPGACSALTQLIGLPRCEHFADQPETMKRWDGRLHDVSGWNKWSWSTKWRAYDQ
jgi:hypothetical protein